MTLASGAKVAAAAGAALVVVGLLAAGCGGDDAPSTPPVLTGLITDVEGEGSDVRAFTLDVGGRSYEIRIAPDVDYGFDLAHLREHQRDSLPVRVELEERDGVLYALRIDDA